MFVDKEKKQVIDVGEVGNASTGDILYAGGVKINQNFDAVYNAFGDQRLFGAGGGAQNQTIHATGYYQKLTSSNANGAIPLGSLLDVDTTLGSVKINLPKGKVGEGIIVINSMGNLSASGNKTFTMGTSAADGATDAWKTGGRDVTVNVPYSKITAWCIEVKANGQAIWDYSVESMFGNKHIPIETSKVITSEDSVFVIGSKSNYSTVKLLLSFVATPGGTLPKRQSSEVMLMIDPNASTGYPNGRVFDTEFAVLRNGEGSINESLYSIKYSINTQNNIIATVSTKIANARFAIKAIDTQSIGA